MIRLIVTLLAAWRIAAWLYYENRVTKKIRGRWRYLDCFWCCANVAAVLVLPLYLWWWWGLLPLAFSGAAILLSQGGRVIWREMSEHGTR